MLFMFGSVMGGSGLVVTLSWFLLPKIMFVVLCLNVITAFEAYRDERRRMGKVEGEVQVKKER